MEHAVLIVDDEPKIYQALRRALHREPYELLHAESGDAALTLLAERGGVDVIIADENMPNMRGSVLLARCKQQWPDMVRMMLTGDARLETIVAAVNKGEIYRFFIKPCNEAELIISIRDALQMRQLKAAAGALLTTVKKQSETIRSMSAQDGSVPAGAELPPIVLTARPKAPSTAGHVPGASMPGSSSGTTGGARDSLSSGGTGGAAGDNSGKGGVFHLMSRDIPEDVDKLLTEIRNELERLEKY
jgi:two-component system, probable response regulator PhcQ